MQCRQEQAERTMKEWFCLTAFLVGWVLLRFCPCRVNCQQMGNDSNFPTFINTFQYGGGIGGFRWANCMSQGTGNLEFVDCWPPIWLSFACEQLADREAREFACAAIPLRPALYQVSDEAPGRELLGCGSAWKQEVIGCLHVILEKWGEKLRQFIGRSCMARHFCTFLVTKGEEMGAWENAN